MLQELAELGMALARAAAQQAQQAWNSPDAAQAAAGPPETQMDNPATAPAACAGSQRDHGLTFERLSRAVRQTIADEAQIAAGTIGGRPLQHRADQRGAGRPPRHPNLPAIRRFLHDTADAEPDRAARRDLHREIDERLNDEAELAGYGDAPPAEIIAAICDDLGLYLDPAKMPDELLMPDRVGATPQATAFPDGSGSDARPPPDANGPDPP